MASRPRPASGPGQPGPSPVAARAAPPTRSDREGGPTVTYLRSEGIATASSFPPAAGCWGVTHPWRVMHRPVLGRRMLEAPGRCFRWMRGEVLLAVHRSDVLALTASSVPGGPGHRGAFLI